MVLYVLAKQAFLVCGARWTSMNACKYPVEMVCEKKKMNTSKVKLCTAVSNARTLGGFYERNNKIKKILHLFAASSLFKQCGGDIYMK